MTLRSSLGGGLKKLSGKWGPVDQTNPKRKKKKRGREGGQKSKIAFARNETAGGPSEGELVPQISMGKKSTSKGSA